MSQFDRKIRPNFPPETIAEEHFAYLNSEQGEKDFKQNFKPEDTEEEVAKAIAAGRAEETKKTVKELERQKQKLRIVGIYFDRLEYSDIFNQATSLREILNYFETPNEELQNSLDESQQTQTAVKEAINFLKNLVKERGDEILLEQVAGHLLNQIGEISDKLSKLR